MVTPPIAILYLYKQCRPNGKYRRFAHQNIHPNGKKQMCQYTFFQLICVKKRNTSTCNKCNHHSHQGLH